MKTLKYIDLFAGAGGLSEGFLRAGFEPIAHVELDLAACFTLKTRTAYHYLKSVKKYDTYISYLKGEITRGGLYSSIPPRALETIINLSIGSENNALIHKLIEKQLDKAAVDIIIGGPPCQAYSIVGRARSANSMSGDPRNYLYVQYARYLERYNPKMFVFENVLGLKSAKDGLYLRNMEKLFFKKGYKMKLFTVEANHFGVLQNRKRIIIVGWSTDINPTIPNLESFLVPTEFQVRHLFNDLPKIQAGGGKNKFMTYEAKPNEYLAKFHIRNGVDVLTQHIARPHSNQDKEIYRIAVNKWNNENKRLSYNDLPEKLKTHKNRTSFHDRFKVVAGNLGHSQTVVAHISKDGHYYIHPDIDQNRSLSVREAARLQSFPDDYYFEGAKEEGSRGAAFKQIGNAVPPLMAFEIAKSIKRIICQKG